MVMKKCKICGKEFDAKGRQVCCSDKCKHKNYLRNERARNKRRHEAGYNFNKYNERKYEESYEKFKLRGNKKRVDIMNYEYEIIFNGKKSGKLYKVYENNNKEFVEDIIVRGNRYHINQNREVVENEYKILRCEVCNKMIISFRKDVKYCSKECMEISRDERGMECMKMFKESYYNALNKAKKLAGYKSELSGKKGKLVVHHLNSYNKDLSGRCDVANMIVLLEEEHKAFHKKYGYGNNSVEQFEEFMYDYIHA